MPPLTEYTFKYLSTDTSIIIFAYSQSKAYNELDKIVKDSNDWLIQL